MSLRYKGYTGHAEYDDHAGILHGEVLGIRDVITFQAKSTDELEQTFRDSVDDYLEFCRDLGRRPEKPFSGKLPLRITPDLHRDIYRAATKAGKSINAWVTNALRAAVSS